MGVEPRISITYTFTPHGWTGDLILPDGSRRSWVYKENFLNPGPETIFECSEDDALGLRESNGGPIPDEVANRLELDDYEPVVEYLRELAASAAKK